MVFAERLAGDQNGANQQRLRLGVLTTHFKDSAQVVQRCRNAGMLGREASMIRSACFSSGMASSGVPKYSVPMNGGSAQRPAAAVPTLAIAPGQAQLTITSGLAAQGGGLNSLSGLTYVLLKDSYANLLAKAGVSVPQGTSPYKVAANECASRSPDCQKILSAIRANTAMAGQADATGRATFSGLAPGRYFLLISTKYNGQLVSWDQALDVKAGANSFTLDPRNATPIN